MILSHLLIYYGNCQALIDFYTAIFDDTTVEVQSYAEMPLAAAYGIEGSELNMIWRASLKIQLGQCAISFKLSDALLIAMKRDVPYQDQAYHPLICIEHSDEPYVRDLFNQLYGGKYPFIETRDGTHCDPYGMRWMYRRSDRCAVYPCFEFDGFCKDVMDYIQHAFDLPTPNITTYAQSPWMGQMNLLGQDKIYRADITFIQNDCHYCMQLSDSLQSATQNTNEYDPNPQLFYQIILEVEDTDKEWLRASFARLGGGAKLNKAFVSNGEGVHHGSLIDRFGIVWELRTCGDELISKKGSP